MHRVQAEPMQVSAGDSELLRDVCADIAAAPNKKTVCPERVCAPACARTLALYVRDDTTIGVIG